MLLLPVFESVMKDTLVTVPSAYVQTLAPSIWRVTFDVYLVFPYRDPNMIERAPHLVAADLSKLRLFPTVL
jgi:hypothetical protein